MSFPRHRQSIVRWKLTAGEEQLNAPLPPSHRLDELQPTIPQRVALLQCPPPLHQPVSSSRQPAATVYLHPHWVGDFSTGEMRNSQPALTNGGILRFAQFARSGHPNGGSISPRSCVQISLDPAKQNLALISRSVSGYISSSSMGVLRMGAFALYGMNFARLGALRASIVWGNSNCRDRDCCAIWP